MIEHARHEIAVHGIENQDESEDEQRQVAFARIFNDQQRHAAADDQVGGIPHAHALGAERHVIRDHVIGAIDREQAISRRDHIVGRDGQLWIKFVRAQRLAA